jgi:hypothetical protein
MISTLQAYSIKWLRCDAHAQKPAFVFRCNGRVHITQRGRQSSSVNYWQPRWAGQLVAFILCWRGYAPRLSEARWIPTPFSCCPFISLPTHHHVPSHLNHPLLNIFYFDTQAIISSILERGYASSIVNLLIVWK